MKNFIVGIDMGGTFIKGGVVDFNGNLICSTKTSTPIGMGANAIAQKIGQVAENMIKEAGLGKENVIGIGIGSPGIVDKQRGEVCFAANLDIRRVPLAAMVEELTSLPVKIANDANCACYGEWKFGSGKKYSDLILVTLGTGVGGGIIIDNKLIEGNGCAGGEIGHMLLYKGGNQCSCGRKGCFEAYVSSGALVRQTLEEMQHDRKTKLWKLLDESKMITPEVIFDMSEKDKLSKKIINDYIVNLSEGLVDLCNIFRPQAIILGGGISNQGDRLIKPVSEYVNEHVFAKDMTPKVDILQAHLGNNAGIVGAASLWAD